MVGKVTLHIYWCDGMTVELRYFPTERLAKLYAKHHGIVNYLID
jgi:hypothetical protein